MPLKLNYNNPGNILLSGVTGFLGAHILDSFLNKESGNVYCIIRKDTNNATTTADKLMNRLHYYFDNKYDNYLWLYYMNSSFEMQLDKVHQNEMEKPEVKEMLKHSTIKNKEVIQHMEKEKELQKIAEKKLEDEKEKENEIPKVSDEEIRKMLEELNEIETTS